MSRKEPNFVYDGMTQLPRGMDSGRAPSLTGPDQAAFLVNTQTRAGFPENRPGWYRHELSGDDFQLGRWQTAGAYIGSDGSPYLLASIGGHIFRFDLINDAVLDLSVTNASLLNAPNNPRAWFCQAETFMVIQDNSAIPLIFDGASLRRANPIAFGGDELPVGNIMEYNNGRLWTVLPDRRTFIGGDLAYSDTGDASDVLRSTQNKFLTGGGSFALPANAGFITAMKSVANQDSVLGQGPLIVFGQFAAGTVNAPFNADEWLNTNSPIVSTGLLSRGPSGQDSVTNVNGDLWYRAQDGTRSFMIARRDHGTWVNTPLSKEMERVITRDDPFLLPSTSTVDFDNRLLTTCSPFRATYEGVEYGVAFRGLTVLDFAPVSSMFDRTQPDWQGIWNGLSILQIIKINCYGQDRCFVFALNDDHEIELWELSTKNLFDNSSDPITATIESRAMGFTDNAESLKIFIRTETWLQKIVGNVTLTVRYRPDDYPFWQDLDNGSLCATKGMCDSPGCAPAPPWPQYRNRLISSSPNEDCDECTDSQFRYFFEAQFQLEISGPFRIRRFRAVADDSPEEAADGCLADKTEECCLTSGCESNIWEYRTPSP